MNPVELVKRQKAYFRSGATKSVEFRMKQLELLKEVITKHEQDFVDAIFKDFRKPEFETYATEIGIIHDEINYALKNLENWTKKQRVSGSLVNFPSKNYTVAEPYGSVLIIAPWNYPVQLALLPVVGAVAAGNTVVIKPSELTPNTSSAIAGIMSTYFQDKFIAVAEGGVEVNQKLLEQEFDYIFFTGSTRVGKIVMKAAAEYLTPVTLELGGKSPCIVDKSANLEISARRIAWGKFLNAGQTCVAPDYILVQENSKNDLLKHLKSAIWDFYGEDPGESPDYPRIVNEDHFNRLMGYLKEGSVFYGGQSDKKERYISPTILTDIEPNASVMEEEIFGPILPVLTFKEIEEAIDIINKKPKPLAFYVFTEDDKNESLLMESCSFGGGAVNDVVAHLGNPNLPFGGIGNSGMGAYHGKTSFDTFSHTKSIMKKTSWLDIPFRYAPYEGKLKWIKKILK
ncbi:aldehyde dehydrogenase [Gracilimonas tropica]|uniref:aldehyde dehydrogenase n=1 Tax=Gracilimonas tropica TaxID=454600 RepID=UPI00037D4EB0|nr:aldehyde dehydrogenase [Gracilimonas tropica]